MKNSTMTQKQKPVSDESLEKPAGQIPAAVLLVDDNSRNLLALESILEGSNYTLVKAQSGDQALLALMAQDFAAIVLDVEMPDVNGIELARLIKKRKKTQNIPIIFLTAHYREDEDAMLGYDVGAVDYLTKPIHPAVLRSKVNVFVDLFRKTQALAELNHNMELEIRERRVVEERFRVVIEASPSAMIVFDENGRIHLVNSQAEKILGYLREEMATRNINDIFPSKDILGLTKESSDTEGLLVETTARRKKGLEIPVEVDCRPIESHEGAFYLASILDITERMRRIRAELAQAEAEAANTAKDRFLAMLSHELRTPLSPIMFSISLLEKEENCPPHMRKALSTIHRNIKLEVRLIDDLLDLARIRNGKLVLHKQVVDVNKVLEDALSATMETIQHRNIRVIDRFEADCTKLQADAVRLQQVFWNLLTNAVKFTPENGTITIHSFNRENMLVIEITDTGIGIEPHKINRIFDAFEQTTNTHSIGLGLGLSICKALVELHGGTIQAFSKGRDSGSTFTIKLPCLPVQDELPIPPAMEVPESSSSRILLVEDHRDTAEALKQLLAASGYEVRIAESMAEAIQVAESYEFDILVSDIGLPDGRGTDLLNHLHHRSEKPIPAIAMSGFGMENDLESSHLAGFAEHLTKPVEFSDLQRALSRVSETLTKSFN